MNNIGNEIKKIRFKKILKLKMCMKAFYREQCTIDLKIRMNRFPIHYCLKSVNG